MSKPTIKELEEILDKTGQDAIVTLPNGEIRVLTRLERVEQSRDELLGALKELMTKAEFLISSFSSGKAARVYNAIILKAQILKEKEE